MPTKKAFKWWVKLPGVTVQCPKCKHQMFVMSEYQVTGGKAIKTIAKVVKIDDVAKDKTDMDL